MRCARVQRYEVLSVDIERIWQANLQVYRARQFKAQRPNQLWISGFTYVSTCRGFVYVALVLDIFARRIVGWRVSSSMRTDFVLDALEQALYARQPERNELVCHSDRGS